MNVVEKTFLNSSDIRSVASSLANDVELIYAQTNNLIAANTAVLDLVASEYKVPFIVGA